MIGALLLALAGASAPTMSPVPPPQAQQSADCARPVYASDKLVCSDPRLSQLDTELVRLLGSAPAIASGWTETQDAWFRRSRMCAFQSGHADCLAAAYRERIEFLRAMNGPPEPAARCRPSGLSASGRPDALVLRDSQGIVVGMAAPATAGWRPLLELRRHAGGYRLHDLQGQNVARCPKPPPG